MATLRELRTNAGLSQFRLAELAGVPFREASRLEHGRPVPPETKAKLLAYFGVTEFDDPPMDAPADNPARPFPDDDDDLYRCQWPLPIPRL
jgi:transcriptional regulator with XRE-family HTH domain